VGSTLNSTLERTPAMQPQHKQPDDFVELATFIPGLRIDAAYASSSNFTGQRVPGYEQGRMLLTRKAAEALREVANTLCCANLQLKIFDAYRPQRAVDFFIAWTQQPDDARLKQLYYPHIDKRELFRLGYLVELSSHSRGSTVDLTFLDADTGIELDMGTPFDFFDPRSRPDSMDVTPRQRAHRQLLQDAMTSQGFVPLAEEWWHFTLRDEPYPDRVFDFPV
jgi:D-alanyl-D-alanine dipeptidase